MGIYDDDGRRGNNAGKFFFKSTEIQNKEAFIEQFNYTEDDLTLSEIGEEKIKNGDYNFTIWVDLNWDDGTVYIDSFKYEIEFNGTGLSEMLKLFHGNVVDIHSKARYRIKENGIKLMWRELI